MSDLNVASAWPAPTWYSNPRPADEHNESAWQFEWLFIRAWSMMSPDIIAGVELDDDGARILLRVPYVICRLQFLWFPASWHQKLWRRGTKRW